MAGADSVQVAMVNTALRRGGAARMAAALNDALNAQEGVRSRLFHCEDNRRDATVIGLKRVGSRPMNALLARLGGAFSVWDRGVAREIKTETRDDHLLHLHNLHGYYLDFSYLLRAWRNRPVVWTWHDMWGATGRCGFSHGCEGWRDGCNRCPSRALYPAAWLDRASREYRHKSVLYRQLKQLAVVSPSDWLAEIAVARGFPEHRVHVIPNPVETDRFRCLNKWEARQALELPVKGFVPLFVAADCADPRKGHEDFVACCRDRGWYPLVVGTPPPRRAAGIHYLGRLADAKQLNRCYAAADVMVIPTFADNYPNTVIESLVSGTPVFGYDEGGVASQLDMQGCAVVPKGDWRALQSRLDAFADEGGKIPQMAEELAAAGRARWACARVTSRYLALYRDMIEG